MPFYKIGWSGIDPTQPTVTLDHWHGLFSWGSISYTYDVNITRTGHVYGRLGDSKTIFGLDGSGAKVYANTYTDGQGAMALSHRNPYYRYFWSGGGSTLKIHKVSNTGIVVKSSNVSWGSNGFTYIWGTTATSGTANSNTAVYHILTSNSNTGNATTTICKINASDMVTVDWAKTTSVTVADASANLRPRIIFTTPDESAIIVMGYRSTLNSVVVILNAQTGATEQSWQTTYGWDAIRKPTYANNIAFTNSIRCCLKSNTGANVANLYISNASWTGAYATYMYDIDYDSNFYCAASRQEGNTSLVVAMLAKYDTNGTRQWQVRLAPTNAANAIIIHAMAASNDRVFVVTREFTESFDGKKWYTSGSGEMRYLYIDAATGNTGTMGSVTLTSNTTTVWSTGSGNSGLWAYTYNPRNTYDFTLTANTLATGTANSATFSKTAL